MVEHKLARKLRVELDGLERVCGPAGGRGEMGQARPGGHAGPADVGTGMLRVAGCAIVFGARGGADEREVDGEVLWAMDGE